eukprot:TRINITY_DN10504_c0_g1_i1.p1 TRINITY_DN10504_c0_g1~~TRINITY_DN10504_c0_g1_i1.p1  ORF type:complete len:257 (-),score=41.50 TRINITY_DN10504_c0_g1_i1:24-794(-)
MAEETKYGVKVADIEKLRNMVLEEKKEWTELEKKYLEDNALARYIRATSSELNKSKKMVLATFEWRKEQKVDIMSCKDCEHHFKHAKNYHNGVDKLGRPITVMRCKLDKNEDVSGKLKIMLYQVERAIRIMRDGVEQTVWLVDCSSFPSYMMNPAHIKMTFKLIDALSNHYPERLGALYIVKAPWIFWAFWKMCAPLVQPATAKKIIFVKKKEDLHEHIDEEVLEEDIWGKNTFKYAHDDYMEMLLKEEAEWLEAN